MQLFPFVTPPITAISGSPRILTHRIYGTTIISSPSGRMRYGLGVRIPYICNFFYKSICFLNPRIEYSSDRFGVAWLFVLR